VRLWLAELSLSDLKPTLRVLSEDGTEADWIERLKPDLNVRDGDGPNPWMPAARPELRKGTVLPVVRVTEAQAAEIRRRATAARMTLAEYMRERALGNACNPVKPESE
jgi:hypothetical protein